MDYSLQPMCGAENRLSCLWEMRSIGELCDATLKTDGVPDGAGIPVHRCVMAACSPYFKAMFTSDLAETHQHEVTIKGVDHETMEAILSYAYCIETCVPANRVIELLVAADLFQMDSLLISCCAHLQEQLTPETVLSTRAYAQLHRCWKLYKFCNEYILKNFRCIASTDEFLAIPLNDLIEIVSNDCLRVKCEEEVYNAVKRWVYHDETDRRYAFKSLIQHVRLPFVSRQFLNTVVQNEKLMLDCQKFFSEAIYYKTLPDKRSELKSSIRIKPRKVFGLNEVMMVVGGTNKTGAIASIDQYDSRTDVWTTLTHSPVPRYGAAACYHNGKVFVAGGSNERVRFIDRLDVYHMVEDKWTEAAPLPIAKRYHSMVALFGLPMVIGGQTHDGVTSSVDMYDPSSNTWSQLTPLNTPRMYHSAVELNGSVYVIGGHSGITRLTSVECNHGLGQWMYIAPLPVPRSVMGATVFTGGIYVAGGYNGEVHVNTVYYYNPTANDWMECQPMTLSRSAFGLVAYDGCLYACGGFNRTLSNDVECYIPGDKEWRTVVSMLHNRIHFSIITT